MAKYIEREAFLEDAEQIVAEYNELDKAHGELFIKYHEVEKQRGVE